MENLLTLEEAAKKLNVCKLTLRNWDNDGKLVSVRTKGGHRRYRESDIAKFQGVEVDKAAVNKDVVAVYARVSSHEQKTKGDLDRQKGRILETCLNLKYNAEYILCDVGSGMSSNRPRLKTLFNLVRERKINKVVVEHKDRLTRFHFGVFEEFFRSFDVVIEAIDDGKERTYEEELVNDMITLMSSFSSKIYGKRSAENRKQRKLAKLAAEMQAKIPGNSALQ